ncbi:MAG: helix-turn-helix transcriptional regulator [Cyclobacteriaceae bacterium]|nr:helix-turn-helix transcriptional regulator [Cyclobacteriaceae bacterium]
MNKLTSTFSVNKERITNNCPLTSSLLLISGRWKLIIIWQLKDGTLRFGDLQKAIPHTSKKMLTQQLKELENDGLVSRKIYPEVPPRVEYTLTELGVSLMPILHSLLNWGMDHNIIEHVKKMDKQNSF